MNKEHEESQELISVLSDRLLNGLIKENPTFVLLLGMCPTLAVTTSAANGLGMGVTTMVVLAMSNLIISALRKVIPNKVRIPAFIVIIASFVTIVELLLKAYIPSLYDALGIYIPLIVVNCIILGRAESYAYSHPVLPSLFDGIGMGMGFSVALTIIGGLREILGSGKFFGYYIMPVDFVPASIFVMAPGAFFVLALLTAIQNAVKDIGTKRGHDMSRIQSGCGGNCMDCTKECKVSVESQEESDAVQEEIQKEDTIAEESEKKPWHIYPGDLWTAFVKKVKAVKQKNADAKAETAAETEQEVIPVLKENPVKKEKSAKKEKAVKEKTVKEKKKQEEAVADTEVSANEQDDQIKAEEVVEKADSLEEAKPEATPEINKNKPEKDVYHVDEASLMPEDDELEIIDLSSLRAGSSHNVSGAKKTGKKSSNRDKAKAMLFKADESVKEDDND